MTTNKKLAAGTALILALSFGILTNCNEDNGPFSGKSIARTDNSHDRLDNLAAGAAIVAKSPEPADVKNAPVPAKRSSDYRALVAMSQLLALAVKPETTLEKMVTRLVEYRIEPDISRQTNSETGDQLNIRSRNPFKGTRYFHALYFEGAGVTPFPQHISFEFRPGPTAFKEAVMAIEQAFPDAGKPIEETATFKKYRVGEDYILWIKKMSAEDLADDPVNAYDPSDTGTVRIAVEVEIHEGEDGGSHY